MFFQTDRHLFTQIGISIVDVSLEARVKEAANQVMQTMLKDRHETTRVIRACCGVEIIQSLQLDNSRGNVTLLANAIGSSRKYAHRVMKAVEHGDIESLFERKAPRFAIHTTEWPRRLSEFAHKPENARSFPGGESVSIRRGVRVPKFLALHSKKEIVKSFILEENCPFGVGVLLCEFPPDIVSGKRDMERNSCPSHANFRRKMAVAKKRGLIQSLSCREVLGGFMCPLKDALNPKSCYHQCALNQCVDCPTPSFQIAPEDSQSLVTYSLWKTIDHVGKKRFGLWPVVESVQSFVEGRDK